MSFENWCMAIAHALQVNIEELEPENWEGLYQSGLTPEEAIEDALGANWQAAATEGE
ncbi:hypothetical protein NFI95_05860 [Acetobacteraceae bacterium KSS8]|uniref:Uncharacterized protein n=1 Tax=Endosaccharibacter trunci TaxID=2812733 RepID=A0ABT1W525_9PROT|nr:hypothetical protein [Acetobacteraceae bacterium KSS8]